MVLRSRRAGKGGADPPTGLNRTMTLSLVKVVPTSASAAAASRGSCVSTSEAVIVRGRSGDGDLSSSLSASSCCCSRPGGALSGLAAWPDPVAVADAADVPCWAGSAAGAGDEEDGGRGEEDIVARVCVTFCDLRALTSGWEEVV